jgi:dynactin 1
VCHVGDLVRIRDDNREGTLAYVGPINVQGASGKFAGINLTKALGKNNGTLEGKRYFEAKDNHGVFVEFTSIELVCC